MMRLAHVTLAIALAAFTAGCFTTPSDYRRQSNGRPRPEMLVGSGKIIEFGKTPLIDAVVAALRLTGGDAFSISGDARRVAVPYSLDVGTRVVPLVDEYRDERERWLILDADASGRTRATSTVDALPSKEFDYWPRGDRVAAVLPAHSQRMFSERGAIRTEAEYDAIDALRLDINAAVH